MTVSLSRLLLPLLLAPLGAEAIAQEDDFDKGRLEALVSTDRVAPGGTFRVAVKLSLEPGWHVQSHRPLEDYLIATELTFEEEPGFSAREVFYPEGHVVDLPEIGGKLSVYEGDVVVGASIAVATDAATGPRTLRSALRIQACDDKACLPPTRLRVAFPIEVGAGEARALHPAIFASDVFEKGEPIGGAQPPAPGEEERSSEDGKEKGLLATLLGIFLLGLALNLTPCVYPVIAVTIGYFGRQAAGRAGGRLLLPSAYAIGIAVTFTALGVAAAIGGSVFGAWLQNRWVSVAIGGLIGAMALSTFGLFDLNPPSWLLSKVGGAKGGVLGALFMGLTMGITAAPCVGPFILTLLLAVAREQDVGKGVLWFGTLSVGLALPYVVLGFFSGSVSALPKSGDWLTWVKKLMGCVLVGVAGWFLLFATGLLGTEDLPIAGAVFLAGTALWVGLLEKSGRAAKGVWFTRGAIVASALIGTFWLLGLRGVEGIEWTPYSGQALAQAKADRRPVMIDFTADWCIPCKGLELGAFKDPRVVAESKKFVRLRVDLTSPEDETANETAKRFGVAGPPTIVFLDASGDEIEAARVVEVVGAEAFLAAFRRALGAAPQQAKK
jgi:thiol:disulfide interchange protein DsbD